MRMIYWVALLASALLVFATIPQAIAENRHSSSAHNAVPQTESLDSFISRYEKSHHDDGPATVDDACQEYVAAKRRSDDIECQKLSPADRRRVQQARNALNDFSDSYYWLQSDLGGGGTLWRHLTSQAIAYNEQAIASIISTMEHNSGGSPRARTRARVLVKKCERTIRDREPTAEIDATDRSDIDAAKRDYTKTLTALRRAKDIQRSLPDQAALRFAGEIKSVVSSMYGWMVDE